MNLFMDRSEFSQKILIFGITETNTEGIGSQGTLKGGHKLGVLKRSEKTT